MKSNRIERKTNQKQRGVIIASVVAVIAVIAGLIVSYEQLRSLWLEQCVINDMSAQVSIDSGKMVKSDVIAEELGLRVGANLALIDFDEKRKALLRRIPNLRAISISRRLPDKIAVFIEERSPIAKLNVRGRRSLTGKVVDVDGVVFDCIPGTSLLPTIREKQSPGTARGHRLEGAAQAALVLVETCRDTDLRDFGILEVDTANPDYLLVTLGNYSRVKLAWSGMNEPTKASSRDFLRRRLINLRNAMRSNVARTDGSVTWDATDTAIPGRIYAK